MQYFNFHSVIFAHCRKSSTTISKVWLRCQQISCLRQQFWKRKSVASQRFSSSSSSCVASKQSTGCQQMQGCSFTATSAITPWLPTHSACCKRAVHQPNPKKKNKNPSLLDRFSIIPAVREADRSCFLKWKLSSPPQTLFASIINGWESSFCLCRIQFFFFFGPHVI